MARVDKQQLWARRIAAWGRSGMSRRAWCAAQGVSANTLDYWRRRLGAKSAPAGRVRRKALVPVVLRDGVPRSPRSGSSATVEVALPGGIALHVPPTVDARWLASLVRELRAC